MLTSAFIDREILDQFKRNFTIRDSCGVGPTLYDQFGRAIEYEAQFTPRIGDTITIKRPKRWKR